MFFHFGSLLYSLIFLATIEALAFWPNFFFYIIAFLIALSVWSSYKVSKKIIFTLVLIIFAFSSTTLLYLVDVSFQKQIFILLSSIVYYLFLLGGYRLKEYSKDQTGRGVISAVSMVTAFFSYAAVYGIYLNFVAPLWGLMLFFLVVTSLISYQYFSIIKGRAKKKNSIYALIMGLAMAEIIWVVNFWPFGYLTTGVVLLIFYYILWDLAQSYLLNILSKKRVLSNMIFFGLMIVIIFYSSRWIPNL